MRAEKGLPLFLIELKVDRLLLLLPLLLIVMELSIACFVTATTIEVQLSQELDQEFEILQALNFGEFACSCHVRPSSAKAAVSAVESTSGTSGRKSCAEQAWNVPIAFVGPIAFVLFWIVVPCWVGLAMSKMAAEDYERRRKREEK
jgi:hypothetical protein